MTKQRVFLYAGTIVGGLGLTLGVINPKIDVSGPPTKIVTTNQVEKAGITAQDAQSIARLFDRALLPARAVPRQTPEPPPDPFIGLRRFQLVGVALDDHARLAVLTSGAGAVFLQEGEFIEGVQMTKINDQAVVFRSGDEDLTLSLTNSTVESFTGQ